MTAPQIRPEQESAQIARAQKLVVELPIKTGSGLNDRLHWRQRSRLVKSQRSAACLALKTKVRPFPAVITLTRLSAGELDDDNLQGALKAIRDGVADAYHLPDNDPRLQWQYAQQRCKRGTFGVRVEIEVIA